jgi:hypothetical protein
MFGRSHSVFTKMLATFSQSGISYEERYGVKRSNEMKQKIGEKSAGVKNPMFGKLSTSKKRTNRGINGFYKGHYFRSLIELSFMKHLERTGLSLDNDVQYETISVIYEFENSLHTYFPDFYIPSQSIIYEIKHSSETKELSARNHAKFTAMENFCKLNALTFKVLTEHDFKVFHSKNDFRFEPNVVFGVKFNTLEIKKMNHNDMKLHDSVLHRIVQIVQEAMLTGVDCADYMRMVRVQADASDPTVLVLTEEYKQHVKESHDKLEKQAIELQTTKSGGGILIN